jgi:hypothetical protein
MEGRRCSVPTCVTKRLELTPEYQTIGDEKMLDFIEQGLPDEAASGVTAFPTRWQCRGFFYLFEIVTPNIWLLLVSRSVGALLLRFGAISQAAEGESAYCAPCLGSAPKDLQATSGKEFGCRRDGRISSRNDLEIWQSRL